MSSPRLRSGLRIAGVVLACAGALYQLSLQARLYAGRVRYPWDIEWLESSALYQAYRVMVGLPTYGPFKDGYIALNHPPGYPVTLGLLGKLFGLGYGMARTVSLLFFLGACALVVRGLRRHQEGRLEGLALGALAVGCAAAGVPVFQGFYDLVREDVMAVFLAVLAASLADTAPRMRPRRIAALALIITAIVYTRQPAVFFAVWVALFVLLRHRRTGFFLALGATALCGLVLVALQFTSKGYYWLLTVGLIQDQRIIPERFPASFRTIFNFAPFIVAVPVVALVLAVRRGGPLQGRARCLSAQSVLWLGMLVASLPASILPFVKLGGFANDFMPTIFMIGPATAFVVSDLLRAFARRPRLALALESAIFAAGAAYLGLRSYDYQRFVPNASNFQRAKALNAKIASLDGGVLCPRHPFFPIQNGHRTLEWSDMPYRDMEWSGFTDLNLAGYIERSKAKWVVLMGVEMHMGAREIGARYRLEGPIGDAPATLVGEHSKMRYLLRRDEVEKDARVLFDFERDLTGWRQTGDALQIVPAKPSWQSAIYGVEGQKLLSSFHQVKRDSATGTLTSPKFFLDRPHMTLRVGGWKRATRVELRVDGKTVRKANGIFENQEVLTKVVWDLADLAGKEAELVMIDDDRGSWGHLLVDHVVLY